MCVTDRQCWKGTERHGLKYIEGHAMSYYSCLLSDLSLSFSSWHDFRELRKRGKRYTSYYFLAHLTGGRVKAAHPFGSLQPQSLSIWHVTRLACLRPRLQKQIYQWAFFFHPCCKFILCEKSEYHRNNSQILQHFHPKITTNRCKIGM